MSQIFIVAPPGSAVTLGALWSRGRPGAHIGAGVTGPADPAAREASGAATPSATADSPTIETLTTRRMDGIALNIRCSPPLALTPLTSTLANGEGNVKPIPVCARRPGFRLAPARPPVCELSYLSSNPSQPSGGAASSSTNRCPAAASARHQLPRWWQLSIQWLPDRDRDTRRHEAWRTRP